jgi:hypothetical protein
MVGQKVYLSSKTSKISSLDVSNRLQDVYKHRAGNGFTFGTTAEDIKELHKFDACSTRIVDFTASRDVTVLGSRRLSITKLKDIARAGGELGAVKVELPA